MSDHPVSATLSTEQLPTAGLWSLEDLPLCFLSK